MSIRYLKQVHDATHPGAKPGCAGAASAPNTTLAPARGVASEDEFLSSLAAEDDSQGETKELAS